MDLPDIQSRTDIENLVNTFYDQVKVHPLLASQFSHVNWPIHMPVMYNFWSSMLLGDQTYQGNPFQKHMHLPIGKDHFSAWLTLFIKTVDDNFRGEKADEIKNRAQTIAGLFQHKLGLK